VLATTQMMKKFIHQGKMETNNFHLLFTKPENN
jgi:hypothetical protein